MIPYGRQDITQADIDAVVEVLQSDFLTQGPVVPEFEQTMASKVGAQHAIAVNSATSALHISCLALGLGPGDWLWTSPVSFVASSNCGLYCGAQIDFVDIDPLTYNMSPAALEEKLLKAKASGTLPKVVIPVHLSGQSCDMEAVSKLSKEYGFSIIEDASHAVGGRYSNEPVGSSRYSDITIFSFHPVKIITTAEGGAAITNSKRLAEKMVLLRSHGITRDESIMTEPPHGDWYYQQIDLGFNYRMTELQAALGIAQIKRLEKFVEKRNALSERYNFLLKNLPVRLPALLKSVYSAFHLYIIRLNLSEISISHREVFSKLREAGVGVNLHYIPIHFQPYYRKLGFKKGDFPNAEKYYEEAISLPMFYGMTFDQQDYVVNMLSKILEKQI